MNEPIEEVCGYIVPPAGPCQKPPVSVVDALASAAEGAPVTADRCPEHGWVRCDRCGKPAERDCFVATSGPLSTGLRLGTITCGVPLCATCACESCGQ